MVNHPNDSSKGIGERNMDSILTDNTQKNNQSVLIAIYIVAHIAKKYALSSHFYRIMDAFMNNSKYTRTQKMKLNKNK